MQSLTRKYIRSQQKDTAIVVENEIRIQSQGRVTQYVSYCLRLLTKNEKGQSFDTITLKGMGKAATICVAVAEIVKRRVYGLHSIISLNSTQMLDIYEPLEKGLSRVEVPRYLNLVEIILSKKVLDQTNVGYQAPIPKEQVTPPDQVRAYRKGKKEAPSTTRRKQENHKTNDWKKWSGGGHLSKMRRRKRNKKEEISGNTNVNNKNLGNQNDQYNNRFRNRNYGRKRESHHQNHEKNNTKKHGNYRNSDLQSPRQNRKRNQRNILNQKVGNPNRNRGQNKRGQHRNYSKNRRKEKKKPQEFLNANNPPSSNWISVNIFENPQEHDSSKFPPPNLYF